MDFAVILEFLQSGGADLIAVSSSVIAILTYMIAFVRTIKKAIDAGTLQKELENAKAEVEIKLKKDYDDKLQTFMSDVSKALASLESKVVAKIDDNEAARKEELRKQTLELEATIDSINSKASIDDILGE